MVTKPQNNLRYVITDRAINIWLNDKRRMVPSDSYMYTILKDQLVEGNVDLDKDVRFNDFVIDSINNEQYFNGLVQKVRDYKAKGLPTKPFMKLLSQIPESVLQKDPDMLSKAGTNDLPITYSGKLIGYQRSSFLPIEDRPYTNWVEQFEPGFVSNGVQTVCEFDYIKSRCPDAGNVYQVLIDPKDIVGFNTHGFEVSKATQLAVLGKNVTEAEKPQSEMLYINSKGEAITLLVPDKAAEILELLLETDPF